MKEKLCTVLLLLFLNNCLSGQTRISDSIKTINLKEIIVTANRLPVTLKTNPGAVSLVTQDILASIPKGIAAEEALRLVPGIRIDNQHDGERVHVSIRGQGILTERGLRGIGVIIDGIPINDPSGFAPDLYDIDWATVKKIEVLRGPAAGLYGGGSAAGVLNVFTADGGPKPFGGEISQSVGSNGFSKSLVQFDGTKDIASYRISFSRTDGEGYRDHQAYWSNKLYEKIILKFSEKFSVTQLFSHTDYFQQNPEGLNISQFDNLRQANPDARPFNEYQKTDRSTAGLISKYTISQMQDVEAVIYSHFWNYKETSNKAAEYRDITNPGASIQYNLHFITGQLKSNISAGVDLKWQNTLMHKLESAADPLRIESIDETNLETDSLLANQIIYQQSAGLFILYKANIGKFTFLANFRYDEMKNQLTNKMMPPNSARISKDFSNTSLRAGASYNFMEALTLFANWSQGFLPPSTEELASNPEGYSGFNTHLVPSLSDCFELGMRSFAGKNLNYELTCFIMNTENDFFRFKQSGRGNQEVFYGNAGNSRRFGIETSLSVELIKNLNLKIAYTYADYKYTSATVDPVYTDETYVLTTPPEAEQWLPNSPRHQLYCEANYAINKNFTIVIGTELQSKWAIYTDAKAYNGELDPAIYQNWQKGFNLFNFNASYNWKIFGMQGECRFSVRNLTGEQYMAFTEPDPDGNSYQPGPGREIFGKILIRF
jgi:iron complex outermembrane receptor protein